jgi:hypothetical protein
VIEQMLESTDIHRLVRNSELERAAIGLDQTPSVGRSERFPEP